MAYICPSILRKACAFDPADRYPSAVELHLALEAAFRRLEEERTLPRRRRRKRAASAPAPTPFAVGMDLFRRRHGRALGMRFHCRRCNGPIAEAMSVAVVRDEGQLVRRDHARAADLPALRARRAAGVDELSLVLGGPLPRQWPAAAPRPAGRAPLHPPRLHGGAAPVHALLSRVQAEARAALEPPRALRSLPALSLAGVARLLAFLRVVGRRQREAGA
jgi:hypothetical protein